MTTTTISQSKRLLELGLDPDTADMYWLRSIGDTYDNDDNIIPLTTENSHIEIERKNNTFYRACFMEEDTLPAWSLEALLKVIPVVNEGTYTMIGTLDGGAIISHKEITCVAFQESSPLNAAFKMVCWLLEKGYIKKGE